MKKIIIAFMALSGCALAQEEPPSIMPDLNDQAIINEITSAAFHEGRGEPPEAIQCIVRVILNRAEKRNMSIHEVLTEKYQFEYLQQPKSVRLKKEQEEVKSWNLINEIVDYMYYNRKVDTVCDLQDHFYAPKDMQKNLPIYHWTKKKYRYNSIKIGNLIFTNVRNR